MVVLESRSHADLQIVGQLLPSVLEHALRVVPIVRGQREREREREIQNHIRLCCECSVSKLVTLQHFKQVFGMQIARM